MRLYEYKDKQVLHFSPHAAEFLKQYTTNVPEAPRTAFIDIKGKIVATAEQKLLNKEEAYIVIGKAFTERLKKHLKPYLLLTETDMRELAWSVYHDLGNDYVPVSGEYGIPHKKGSIILTSKKLPAEVTEEAFLKFRLENNIPLQGFDYDEEMLLSVGNQEFVSYEKGCYLGQEIIARVHYKGKPPKRLVADPAQNRWIFVTN